MQKMKSQRAMAGSLMAGVLVTVFTVGFAFAQQGVVMRVNIPYEFSVGSKALPPGTYALTVNDREFGIQSATNGATHLRIITQLGGPTEFFRDGALVFDTTGGGHILSEVWIPGADGILLHSSPGRHNHQVLFVSDLSETRVVPGKTAYNQACSRCHGVAGKGDTGADHFFKTKIPRLNSPEVQAKSDAQLKQIIMQGTSTMPPVEVDESGYRHRLPPQDVDTLVSYLRTLKP